ncbi:MAG TPA: XisI protein [Urbifossiella sp.]|nr:XisI protein [Urbifossiella sp.]
MDRVADYRAELTRIMTRHAAPTTGPAEPGVETVFVSDAGRDEYVILDRGWRNGRRVDDVIVHARIADGKVWVEQDWTDGGIATELVRAGVPRSDIVLGFHPPELRHLTDFAVA